MVSPDGSSTVPSSVPYAMVETGISSAATSSAADSTERPWVLEPSDRSTMWAGGGSVSACLSRVRTASRAATTASPIAVPCPVVSRSMAERSSSRSVVGGTATVAEPLNWTRPALKRSGSRSTKASAACWAASNRVGSTSVAPMEADTSNATTTVARSRGTRTSVVGRANPTTSSAIVAQKAAAGMCRRRPGRFGATLSSRSRLVNLTAYRPRLRCTSR